LDDVADVQQVEAAVAVRDLPAAAPNRLETRGDLLE